MKPICIITARGGSKRILNKNTKDFCGKPIITYSIRAALDSNIFEKVIVSTDSEEIKKIALTEGAEVPFMRSVKNSDDHATTTDVLFEVLNQLDGAYEEFCCLYPTAPLLTKDILNEAYLQFKKLKANSLIPVVKFSYPPQRGLKLDHDKLIFNEPQHLMTRSQDLPTLYHDIGQFYFAKTKAFLSEKKLFMENTVSFEINPMSVQDIDTPEDWEIAEFKFKYLNK